VSVILFTFPLPELLNQLGDVWVLMALWQELRRLAMLVSDLLG
jgi:hypothetical protein